MGILRRLAFALSLLVLPTLGWSQSPSVDYASLLTGVKAHDNGTILIDQIGTLFAPQDALYTGAANEPLRFYVTLNRDGQELQRLPHILQPVDGVFARLQAMGPPPIFKVPGPGQYQIDVVFDDSVIASLPFAAEFVGGSDPFAPDKQMLVTGPWSHLAMLTADPPADPGARLGVVLWLQTPGGKREDFNVRVLYRGQTIYETRNNVVATSNPGRSEFELQFPKAAGGDWVRVADFVKQDGLYQLVVNREDQEIARYSYEVAGGKIKPNPRSALDYQPHAAFLTPRSTDPTKHGRSSDNYWAEAGNGPAAEAPATGAAGPTAADLKRWQVATTYDPKRPFSLVNTPVVARFDAALSAGDGVIAFGTGGFNGVAYMRIGDTESRSIPEGQSFRSAYVKVAGKKIVLVNGNSVAVFDTVTGELKKIPTDDIYLALPVKSLHEANPLDVSGYLVATINDARKVKDRSVVKLIDLSGPEPVIFALSNADFQGREATAVAVDAASGQVAVSSQRKSAIYTAKAAPGAALTKHDLSGQDGVGNAPLIADHGLVAYRDAAGKAKFRLLDDTGRSIAIGTLGPAVFGYAMNAGAYAYGTVDGYGSDYAYATARAPAVARPAAGTGGVMKGGNGKLGFGQTAAIAPDGTLFIAGMGKGGLGSGEFLMGLIGGSWHEYLGADGKALPACDVVIGDGLLAFKSGSRNDTTISYATFGARIGAE